MVGLLEGWSTARAAFQLFNNPTIHYPKNTLAGWLIFPAVNILLAFCFPAYYLSIDRVELQSF
jgi:hypothetical protein